MDLGASKFIKCVKDSCAKGEGGTIKESLGIRT